MHAWLCSAHKNRLMLFLCLQLLLFLKGFTDSERTKLAMLTGILLANGNISASILSSLYNENIVKEGTSLSASQYFQFFFPQWCVFEHFSPMN